MPFYSHCPCVLYCVHSPILCAYLVLCPLPVFTVPPSPMTFLLPSFIYGRMPSLCIYYILCVRWLFWFFVPLVPSVCVTFPNHATLYYPLYIQPCMPCMATFSLAPFNPFELPMPLLCGFVFRQPALVASCAFLCMPLPGILPVVANTDRLPLTPFYPHPCITTTLPVCAHYLPWPLPTPWDLLPSPMPVRCMCLGLGCLLLGLPHVWTLPCDSSFAPCPCLCLAPFTCSLPCPCAAHACLPPCTLCFLPCLGGALGTLPACPMC